MLGHGNGGKAAHPLKPAQALQIVAADEPAHAETCQVKRFLRPYVRVNEVLELQGQHLQALRSRAGPQAGRVHLQASLCKVAGHRHKNFAGIKNTMNQHQAVLHLCLSSFHFHLKALSGRSHQF